MDTKKYSGIVIKESIVNDSLLEEIESLAIDIYPHKLNGVLDTTIYKLELDESLINEMSLKISENLLPKEYYVHFISGNEMIVIYPNRIYKFDSEETDVIAECKKYGKSIGIDANMMKFDEMFRRDHPNDKNAIVFGGSGDLGLSFCEILKEEGYKVYFTYGNNKNNESEYEQFRFEAAKNNNELYAILNRINIDCLVFCIGARSSKKNVVDTDIKEYERLLSINALSFLEIYKNLAKNLRHNQAKILVVSSSASLENKKTNGAYSSSKACLDSIVETLKKEEAEFGVDIELIHPSLFDSKLAREIVKMKGYTDFDKYVDDQLDGSIKTSRDIANENRLFLKKR